MEMDNVTQRDVWKVSRKLGAIRWYMHTSLSSYTFLFIFSEVAAYSSYYSLTDYPITKALREPVYVEVRVLDRSDPNVVLTLDHCWATSAPEPDSLPQWDLLLNGYETCTGTAQLVLQAITQSQWY